MATNEWSAGFEASPPGTQSRKLGDDRIRELKLAIRERLQKGGHFMQDPTSGTAFAKDGRHVIGVGDGPTIYKTDAVSEAVRFTDAAVQLKGVQLTSDVGNEAVFLAANAITKGFLISAATGVIAPVGGSVVLTPASFTLSTPKGATILSLQFRMIASVGVNDSVRYQIEYDYDNDGGYTIIAARTGLYVPLRGGVGKGFITHGFSFYDPMTTSVNGVTVPWRITIVNDHATSVIDDVSVTGFLVELRK